MTHRHLTTPAPRLPCATENKHNKETAEDLDTRATTMALLAKGNDP